MKESSYTLTRRQLLRNAALILGISAVPPGVASAVLSGAGKGKDAVPNTLTPPQFQLVSKLSGMIIPESDTPGAVGAGVPLFIDALLTDYCSAGHCQRFLMGLREVDALARPHGFSGFLKADDGAQLRIVKELDEEAYAQSVESVGAVFFREFKEMVLIGYYTSEVGARVELAYAPVPGEYDGCVPLSKSGRAWATNGFPTSRIKVTHA